MLALCSHIRIIFLYFSDSLRAQLEKNMPAMQETPVQYLGWEGPLEKEMATHSVFLPGEFHGQRSLASIVLGVAEWDMTNTLTLHDKH